jgi:hypothetical protein
MKIIMKGRGEDFGCGSYESVTAQYYAEIVKLEYPHAHTITMATEGNYNVVHFVNERVSNCQKNVNF